MVAAGLAVLEQTGDAYVQRSEEPIVFKAMAVAYAYEDQHPGALVASFAASR